MRVNSGNLISDWLLENLITDWFLEIYIAHAQPQPGFTH